MKRAVRKVFCVLTRMKPAKQECECRRAQTGQSGIPDIGGFKPGEYIGYESTGYRSGRGNSHARSIALV
ncbi:hypothetical protein SDC9_149881 [bioreactor metagenome]|uniref:Uncharacterized protein n=1 Tax=bioreactor metagenome TaxID=1076179 RepID=A0A645EKU8_9ZZZZ